MTLLSSSNEKIAFIGVSRINHIITVCYCQIFGLLYAKNGKLLDIWLFMANYKKWNVFGYMQVSDQILYDKTEDEIQWNLRVVINISIVKNVGDTDCFVT